MATETLYILEIKIPDEDSQRVPVQGKVSVGSGADVDICIEDYGLAPRHCTFRDNNEILTVHNTGGEGAVVVGKQKLSHGKMYIIDKGDSVKLGDLTFVVRTEDAEVQYIEDEEETSTGVISEHEDEQEGKTRSIMQRLTGLFKKNTEEEEDEEEEIDIQVIDHSEDEDEEEDESPRQVKASGGLGKVSPKKVNVSPYLKLRRAGVIVRLLGFLLNLAMVYSAYLYALPMLKAEEYFQKIFELITPFIEKALPFLTPHVPENILLVLTGYTTIKIIIIFMALEIASSMLFGCSLGLFFLGATGHGTFLGKRIKAVFRSIFSFITSPLIIFELPVILKFRTLKEVLSFSQIEKRSNALSFLLGISVAPLGILAALLWPLMNDPILLQMPEYEVSAKAPKKKGKRKSNFTGASTYLGLKVNFFKKPSMEFIPSYEKSGIKLYAMDLKKGKKVTISKSKEIDLNPAFKTMLEMNPFFPSFSSELYFFMAEQKSSKNISAEIASLTRDSLGLTPFRLHEVLLDHGPYINGLMDIRMTVLGKLGISNKFKATSYIAGRKDYLLLEEESSDALQRIVILPLGEMVIRPFILSFKAKDRALANSLVESLFKSSGRLAKGFKFDPSGVKEWNDLSLLDYFSSPTKAEASSDDVMAMADLYKAKIEILKAPEGIPAKAKKLYTGQLRKALKRTAKEMGDSPLSSELLKLVEELPKSAQAKAKKKKEE